MPQKFLPRLTKADVEALMRAHVACVEADKLLQQTNWAGAGACRVLVGNADVVIAALWNKVERALKAGDPAISTESGQEVHPEPQAGAGTAAAEIAPPDKTEAGQ
jgi:hypothetical protein